ncbi:MAG: DNA mismatch repair endonuclease MutL [Candidatus Marinimicrobia bacterium]|nr:DNA mismatch repair endonuclease MutL [Candidatus Neomarinimicrobiota bacterium]
MPNIRLLPSDLINQIAAGEVVERPASVVKELIENSLDANATHIDILILDGGKSLIQISDDGCGMNGDNLKMSVKRHATSKIDKHEDLSKIHTLGFRGEALPSIASISQLNVKSSTNGIDGNEISIHGDEIKFIRPVGCVKGTAIKVNNLFFNTPARRKFLKKTESEQRAVTSIIRRFALSYPKISFSYTINERNVYKLKSASLRDRISQIYGKSFARSVLTVSYKKNESTIDGFVGNLSQVKKRQGEQFLFLNGRFIKDRLLNSAVYSAYRSLIARGEFPFSVLNLNIPLESVDVNVHPAKLEVRFQDEWRVYHVVKSAITEALGDLLGALPGFAPPNSYIYTQGSKTADISFGGVVRNSGDFTIEKAPRPMQQNDASGIQVNRANERIENITKSSTLENLEISNNIWQIKKKYIVTEVKSGMIIIDQHVAHERILYEAAQKALDGNGFSSQTVLFPQTVKFLPDEYSKLIDIIPYIEKIGFRVREFGENTVVVEGVPPDVHWGAEGKIIKDILDKYLEHREFSSSFLDYISATYACKAAIKAGDKLSQEEMKNLVDRLFATEHPYYCPHGRPIIINLSIEELDKRFERL